MDYQPKSLMTVEQRTHTAEILTRRLGPEYIAQRSGGSAGGLTYIEGSKAIELANAIFGFDGWSTWVRVLDIDFIDTTTDNPPRHTICCSSIVRVTLRDGSFHEDIGHGKSENQKSKADAIGNAKKTAVTDGTKRALRLFGDLLGNCLYDKAYLSKLKGMARNPVRPAFDRIQRGGVAANVLPINPFPPGQGPVSLAVAEALNLPLAPQPGFMQPLYAQPIQAEVAPTGHSDRSVTADAELIGFAEGDGDEEIGDGGEDEMDMVGGDEYGMDDSGYLEACERDEKEKAAAAPRAVSPKSPIVPKQAPPGHDRFAANRLAAQEKKKAAVQDNSARRNSNPLPKSNETPIAPRSAAQAPHKKIPVVAAGTVASVNVGGSNGKLQQAKPQVGVSAASRLSTKRELESPSVAGRSNENRNPLEELPAGGRDVKRPRQ